MNPDGRSSTIRTCARQGVTLVAAMGMVVLIASCRSPHVSPTPQTASVAPRVNSSGCDDVITASIAQDVFDRLHSIHASDRCALHGLATQQSTMRITWDRDGAVLPGTFVVTPRSCSRNVTLAAGRYAIEGSDDLRRECPATYAAMVGSFRNHVPDPVHPVSHSNHPRKAVYGILALLALGAMASLARRVRASQR